MDNFIEDQPCQGCCSCFYAITGRLERNIMRITLTGGLSFAGTVIAGHPSAIAVMGVGAIFFGGALSGIANALSTGLSLETSLDNRLAELENEVVSLKRMNSILSRQGFKEPLAANVETELVSVVVDPSIL